MISTVLYYMHALLLSGPTALGILAVGTAAMCASLILLLQSIHVVTPGELTPGTGSLAR